MLLPNNKKYLLYIKIAKTENKKIQTLDRNSIEIINTHFYNDFHFLNYDLQ